MSWLADQAGMYGANLDLFDQLEEEVRDEGLAELVNTAEELLRARIAISRSEFFALSTIEKRALSIAGDRLTVELAIMIGRSSRSALEEKRIGAILDDGEHLEESILSAAVSSAAIASARRTDDAGS